MVSDPWELVTFLVGSLDVTDSTNAAGFLPRFFALYEFVYPIDICMMFLENFKYSSSLKKRRFFGSV
jgi:hypothetical protein